MVVLANPGFGLYVHWPYCQSKCPYCDFNSHVTGSVDHDRWKSAFLAELARFGQETPGRQIDSIFFGGGTPSLMDPDVVAAIIDLAQQQWTFSNNIEITLEANPTSIELGKFVGFRTAGVNRVSVGIQALDDPSLKRLGRLHSSKEAVQAFDIAGKVFDRSSFDLIYARQDQSAKAWESELRQAIDMAGEHLSLYQLTIEPGTAFGARHLSGGLQGLPDEELQADMFELTNDICADAGLPAYEISNHARPGGESRHNLIYWRGGDWFGLGPGAHGRLTLGGNRYQTVAPSAPVAWLEAVENKSPRRDARERLSSAEVVQEYILMSLRIAEGANLQRINDHGHRISYQSLIDLGMVAVENGHLKLAPAGRPLLNAVLREIAIE